LLCGQVDLQPGTAPLSVAIGRFDGDGKTDLAVANITQDRVSVYRNTVAAGSICPQVLLLPK